MKGIYQTLTGILDDILKERFDTAFPHPLWEPPAKQTFGDYSCMLALKLASKMKKNPLELAAELKQALADRVGGEIEKIEVIKPGFVNVFISPAALKKALQDLLREQETFFRGEHASPVLVEFVSANPTGPLSIAHGRQAVVGDVVARILELSGYLVQREYYLNDVGRQIELFGMSVEAAAQNQPVPQDGYHGEYVREIGREYAEHAQGESSEVFSVRRMRERIECDLAQLGVSFHNWTSQRTLIEEGKVDAAVAYLRERGLVYEQDEALWFASTRFGDDKDRVIKKQDGRLTYFASDIAYHRDKCARGFDRLINLWGPDHHGYIPRVKASIEALGSNPEMLEVLIIQLVSIKTKERMSRRKGTAILLKELIDQVGKDAARFYYLTRRNSSHLEFDIDLAREASFNNPLYYIQYACARIESIFEKAGETKWASGECGALREPAELDLVRFLLQFTHCCEKAAHTLEPMFIIEYLKALAARFHKFYETHKVLGDDPEVVSARLNLIDAARIVLHCGLSLLGITPAKKM
ncbi:MAG: arginine--tRNA ligase [Candidatus Omnitrophica bacterium]|nr:arginine--tRNA ligase [Candidatus Omnitrophota bacterium]